DVPSLAAHHPLAAARRLRDRGALLAFPTRRSSDLSAPVSFAKRLSRTNSLKNFRCQVITRVFVGTVVSAMYVSCAKTTAQQKRRSEEHTSELQSREKLVCRLLLEKKKTPASLR